MKTKTLANQNERLARVILTEMEIAFWTMLRPKKASKTGF